MTFSVHCQTMLSLALLGSCANADAANQWTVCNLEISVAKVMRQGHMLSAHVVKAIGKNPISCPGPGTAISFAPETADYQGMLSKRLWPRVGTEAELQYRYLDGVCKDRGPCRIEHYAIVGTR